MNYELPDFTDKSGLPPDWTDGAACKGMNPETFYPPKNDFKALRLAVRVCFDCSVESDCLKYALANNIRDGVYGGTVPSQRRRLRYEYKRDRLRNNGN